MIRQIKELLRSTPFAPFKIRTGDGREHPVLTGDHAFVSPNNSQVIVFENEEVPVTLSGLHIVSVEGPASVA
jgi:hypothetical protein